MEMDLLPFNRSKLMIVADDFGISQDANNNILDLIELGKLDRVGIMIRGVFSEAEIATLQKSGIMIDLHLDILHIFSDKRKNRKGFFTRTAGFLLKIFSGKASPKKVRADWEEQIEMFYNVFNRKPNGINSHEHIHFFPPFFKIVLKLQEENLIPFVRFGKSVSVSHHKLIVITLRLLRKISLKKFLASCFVSTDSLASLDWIDDVDTFLENLPEGTIEIACHPETAEDFVKIKKYF